MPGTRLFRAGRQLYIVRADASDRLLVVNTSPAGDLLWLLGCSTLLLGASYSGAYASGRTFLRKYFLLTDSSAHSYADALQLGEGLTIEFKRSISFDVQHSVDRVLETIAAFANTAGGTIFIGVEDNGKVHGLRLEGTKARDALNERIHQSVRYRVRPSPVIQTAFLEAEGRTVCRILSLAGSNPCTARWRHICEGRAIRYQRAPGENRQTR